MGNFDNRDKKYVCDDKILNKLIFLIIDFIKYNIYNANVYMRILQGGLYFCRQISKYLTLKRGYQYLIKI